MMQSRFPAVVAVVFLAVVSPSALWGSCNVVPHDGTAENGFGAASGFSVEYCGLIQPPPECTVDGWYFPVTQGTSFTRTGGQSSLTYTSLIREAVESGSVEGGELLPGLPMASKTATTTGILAFPSSSIADEPFVLPPVIRPVFSCAEIVGNSAPGVFIVEDRSPTTPLNPGFGSTDGGVFESLLQLSPQYRALGTSSVVTPFAAQLDGSQMVPPAGTPLTGSAQMDGNGDVYIQVPGLTGSAANIRILRGQAGVNGTAICSFPGAPIPFLGSCPEVAAGPELILFLTAKIHIEVDGGPSAEGVETIRGQVMPANLLFMDGFETGDIDRW